MKSRHPLIKLAFAPFQEDLTLAGYKRHMESAQAPPPLTADEQELKLLKESEVR